MTTSKEISAGFPFESQYVTVNGHRMHYVEKGCFYPKGGSSTIVLPLVSTLRANGSDVLCKARVLRIDCVGNRAVGALMAAGRI